MFKKILMNNPLIPPGCPNTSCSCYGRLNPSMTAVHDARRGRFRCRECGRTWSAHRNEFHYGLRTNPIKVRRAMDMLQAGLSIRQIARLVDVNAGTVMRWKKKLNPNNY